MSHGIRARYLAVRGSVDIDFKRSEVCMYTILLVILILLLLGALPTWPYSRSWGYYPSGGLGLVVVIVIILLLAGRL